MDKTDRELLNLLQRDGRRPSADLAKEIGLSVSATNERVRKLLDTGLVRTVEAVVDPVRSGFGVTAFVFVDLDYSSSEDVFVSKVAACSEILEVHHVTGTHSYLLKVRERTNEALNAFMNRSIKCIPGVRSTETLIALSTQKETLNLPL
ncbi:Lrp/AsnC family transcriptional regulator, regulator for asnA, asnC and gidA [Cohaesibacter sp. ES.047]|uniref:Lrp/AsnC family transcriptional regulator n=1 Tax=Cohaesibacter sp. ES.047 TaxID=1798205 RepID=UPI000BB9749D|nr:Lrp/AsnC family transcriptional regulator [Cohaesibacter sp. ES.047]SNY92837.1 Lrp/AsnC family transcriptional regulator, regulator for asnA, asnC and gidA [Cohaesibacter sp. ES.047]